MRDGILAVSSWSGGKESCLACYRALETGSRVSALVNFVSRGTGRGCFHGIQTGLMQLQSRLIGIPLVQKKVSPDMAKYEEEFKEAVNGLKKTGVREMIFGDVYLEEQRNWVQRVCLELGIRPVEPLWGTGPQMVMEDFIETGFEAIVTSCKADLFDETFLGRRVDKSFLKDLQTRGICPCGENGEYHTFVVDGPMFKNAVKITKSKSALKKGWWKHWFLDIQEYTVV